jgi:XRE family transcriptional regulator, fatty acid utilization regulator
MASLPASRKLYVGQRLRRLRVQIGVTQTRMADDLGLSVSYLNLIERNQRPLTASVLLRLAEAYDVDLRQLTADDSERLAEGVRAALGHPALSGIELSRAEVQDFVSQTPAAAQAFLQLHAAAGRAATPVTAPVEAGPLEAVRDIMLGRRNHFPDLEARAEALADEIRIAAPSLFAGAADRLRARHGLGVRILPAEVMPGTLRRLDYHGRQVQLSELLDPASRAFQLAYQLGLIEAKAEIDAVLAAERLADKSAERLLVQNLASYFAAALMMPYARFHAACEATGYDIDLLQVRFGAGFEMVAHRLTTLHRTGTRGIGFSLLRTDRAGQISKRIATGPAPFARSGGTCPLWTLHAAFDRPGAITVQAIETEDGARWLSVARTVRTHATPWGTVRPDYAIALLCPLADARPLTYAQGLDLDTPRATPVGPACATCERENCRQRSAPPARLRLAVDERTRGLTPFRFAVG